MTDSDATTAEEGTDDGDDRATIGPVSRARLRWVAHRVGLLLLLAIVVPFLLYAVPQLIGAEHSYVVLSGSMEPTMSPGDVIFVDAVGVGAIAEGDVINFKRGSDERATTHRVIEVVQRDGEPAFRTQGDSNDAPDQGVVTGDELQGRLLSVAGVPLVIPLIGYVIQFANTQLGFALLFVLPIALLVAFELRGVVTSARSGSPTTEADGGRPSSGDTSTQAPSPDGADDDGGISFTATELQFGLVVLAAFAAYSTWVAVSHPGVWTVGVAGSVIVALLLVAVLYITGRAGSDGGSDGREASDSPTGTQEVDDD